MKPSIQRTDKISREEGSKTTDRDRSEHEYYRLPWKPELRTANLAQALHDVP